MRCDSDAVVAYDIDAADRITWVCEHWWPFARDNSAAHLRPEDVIGRNLLGFISDPTTRELYERLFARVRATHRSISLDVRCDSPDRRRLLHFTMSPSVYDGIAIASRTVREEVREPVSLLAAPSGQFAPLIVMCSWCKRVQVDGEWLEVEAAVQRLGLMETATPPPITHGICPSCLARVSRMLSEKNLGRKQG